MIRQFIKQCIPPIIFNVLRKIKDGSAHDGNLKSLKLSDDSYRVDFKRVEIGSDVYFVPVYAMHRPACRDILAGRYYEPRTHELIQALLETRPGNMIHAGTFFGDMLPSFSKKCPGTVYAFEPVLESYLLAKLCVQQNNLSNVLLWNAGLGKEISIAHIDTGEHTGLHNGGGSQIGNVGQITSLICIDTLSLKDISVIQLDVEGFELEALKGAVNTIEKYKPAVLVEDNSNNCEPFLKSLGYVSVGNVPGLTVWSDVQNEQMNKNILQRLS